MSTIVSPSILSADFMNLQKDIELVNSSSAEWIHLDIMDGSFVPNITFGVPVLKNLRSITDKVLDFHLMIVNPDLHIDSFIDCGADMITVHYEACTHLHRTISYIKSRGVKAGVALNPHTPISVLEEIISDLDLVLIMSVNPGFGGQSFIESSLDKVKRVKMMIEEKGSSALIEIDGGVNETTGKQLVEAGADALVAGNYVFNSDDPLERVSILNRL